MAWLCPQGKLMLQSWPFSHSSPGLPGPAWVLIFRDASLSLLPLIQGQLELLRTLFTEALYEEALSQVSGGR